MILPSCLILSLLDCLVDANKFIIPDGGYEFAVGEPTTIKWDPSTNGTVTLELLWGAVIASEYTDKLGSGIPNNGSYTWTPPENILDLSNYTICLYPDEPPQDFTCMPNFSVEGASDSEDAQPMATSTETSSTSTPEKTPRPSDATDDTNDNKVDNNSEDNANNEGLSTGAKAGIGVGIAAGVLILFLAGMYFGRRRRQPKEETYQQPDIPLTSQHTPASITTADYAGYEGPADFDTKGPTVNEMPGREIREMGGASQTSHLAEAPPNSLQELDGRNYSGEAVELPTIEHKFV
ncbi:GPI anchored serine-threonine rich family protein [Aspergillus lucknowensis]|uniref:Yeast cell wall synthesis Kre9/Knh1-like N-terminal domain-containing protein n=1 Tax=Aspergillus lucknowensis TaxID=176173 RepID=A0ABR4LEB8_9EURO